MSRLLTRRLGVAPDAIAPDGSEVRLLASATRGSMGHFTLQPAIISRAVAHRTIEEVWFFIAGEGRLWRSLDQEETIVEVRNGVSITIPAGAGFQFRCDGEEPLEAVGVTMPPWPGIEEAYAVEGKW